MCLTCDHSESLLNKNASGFSGETFPVSGTWRMIRSENRVPCAVWLAGSISLKGQLCALLQVDVAGAVVARGVSLERCAGKATDWVNMERKGQEISGLSLSLATVWAWAKHSPSLASARWELWHWPCWRPKWNAFLDVKVPVETGRRTLARTSLTSSKVCSAFLFFCWEPAWSILEPSEASSALPPGLLSQEGLVL